MKYFYYFLLAIILIFSCIPKASFAISDDESGEKADSLAKKQCRKDEPDPKIFSPAEDPVYDKLRKFLPAELHIFILDFLNQKALLKAGGISKKWRETAKKIWEKRNLTLLFRNITGKDYEALEKGIFKRAFFPNIIWECKEKSSDPDLSIKEIFIQYSPDDDNFQPSNEEIIKFIETLDNVSHLTELDLSYTHLKDDVIGVFAGIWKHHPDIKKLRLVSCSISNEGGEVLASALQNFSKLKDLDLSWNEIQDIGAYTLTQHFPQSLRFISLSRNPIGSIGLTALICKLPGKQTKLNLAGMDKDISWEIFVTILKDKTTITTLDLSENYSLKAKHLSLLLKDNKHLTNLAFNYNSTPEKVNSIAESLKTNVLENLSLEEGQINTHTIQSLANGLRANSTLRVLNMRNNVLSNESKQILEDLMKDKPQLNILYDKKEDVFTESDDESEDNVSEESDDEGEEDQE